MLIIFVITFEQKWQFIIFQNGGRPPSCIFKVEILTVCRLGELMHFIVTNLIIICKIVVQLSQYFDIKYADRPPF